MKNKKMAEPKGRDLPVEEKLAAGLSHEPQIVRMAEWLINGKSLEGYLADYDDSLAEMERLYGMGKKIVNRALTIAEERVFWGKSSGEA